MSAGAPSTRSRALVTGVKRIGGAVALALARNGADLALACHTSRTAADATAADIRGLGRRAVVIEADLTSPTACQELVARAASALDGLSILILAASRFDRQPFADLDAAAWDRALAVDLDASFHCVQAAVPHLRRAGGGHVVLFADWVAQSGRPRYRGYLPYYVAKRGVIALGEALALELAADRIQVHVIAPGPILPVEGSTEEEHRAVLAATPLGRWGGAAEVGDRVAALVGTRFFTGETVRVDGGRHLL